MKKGKYYIGDPCYVFGESWGDILDQTDYFNGECKVHGKECFGGGTAYGDGTYHDQFGREYWVDAGLLAIIPVEVVEIEKKQTIEEIEKSTGMHIVDMKEDFKVSECGGDFYFGEIHINTKDED